MCVRIKPITSETFLRRPGQKSNTCNLLIAICLEPFELSYTNSDGKRSTLPCAPVRCDMCTAICKSQHIFYISQYTGNSQSPKC